MDKTIKLVLEGKTSFNTLAGLDELAGQLQEILGKYGFRVLTCDNAESDGGFEFLNDHT